MITSILLTIIGWYISGYLFYLLFLFFESWRPGSQYSKRDFQFGLLVAPWGPFVLVFILWLFIMGYFNP